MSTRCTERRGIGATSVLAMVMPAILFASGLALSMQSSAARRFAASAWASYLACEAAEGAVAEAAHFLRIGDLFDPAVFGPESPPEGFAAALASRMVADQAPLDGATDQFLALPLASREYRPVFRGPVEVRRMLTAFRFPPRTVAVTVPGVARRVAQKNPGVRLAVRDLTVTATPLSYRREYYRETTIRYADPLPRGGMKDAPGPGRLWVGWGVVRFNVKARVDDMRGASCHELEVDRRFAVRSDLQPGEEPLKVSSLNLRTSIRQVDP